MQEFAMKIKFKLYFLLKILGRDFRRFEIFAEGQKGLLWCVEKLNDN